MFVSGGSVSAAPVSSGFVYTVPPVVVPTYFDYVQTLFVITWTRPQIVAYQLR